MREGESVVAVEDRTGVLGDEVGDVEEREVDVFDRDDVFLATGGEGSFLEHAAFEEREDGEVAAVHGEEHDEADDLFIKVEEKVEVGQVRWCNDGFGCGVRCGDYLRVYDVVGLRLVRNDSIGAHGVVRSGVFGDEA